MSNTNSSLFGSVQVTFSRADIDLSMSMIWVKSQARASLQPRLILDGSSVDYGHLNPRDALRSTKVHPSRNETSVNFIPEGYATGASENE